MLNAIQQALFNVIIAALIAAGIVIAEAGIAAIVACLTGPCELASLVAALGAAAAGIVRSLIAKNDEGTAAAADPVASASEGVAAGPADAAAS